MYEEEYSDNDAGRGALKRPVNDMAQESRPNLLISLSNQERLISVSEKQFSELYGRLTPVLKPLPEDAIENAKSPTSDRLMDVVESHNNRLEALNQAIRSVTKNLDV